MGERRDGAAERSVVSSKKSSKRVESKSIWPNVKADLLSECESTVWTDPERAKIKGFGNVVQTGDRASKIRAYITLVEEITPPSMRATILASEMGRLVERLDPHAYDNRPLGNSIHPADLVAKPDPSADVCRRFDGWAKELPQRLHALKLQILQCAGTTVADFPGALLELEKLIPRNSVIPAEVKIVFDAIRRGRTSIARISHHDLIGFFWPASQVDFAEHLSAKEAVQLVKTACGVDISERTLYNHAEKRASLKSGSKYVKQELLSAANDGAFKHGNAKGP